MGRIRAERLEIETVLPVFSILEFTSEAKPNCHGICHFKFQLQEGIKEDELDNFLQESPIKVWEAEEQGDILHPIFAGQIEEVELQTYGGSYFVKVKAITGSVLLDRMPQKRTFQSPGMTYREIAEQIAGQWQDARIEWHLDNHSSPDGLLVQYNETDWEFLVRLASHLNSSILVDERQEKLRIYFGIKENGAREAWEDTIWEAGISPLYYINGHWQKKDRRAYTYFTLKRSENHQVGEAVILHRENRIICNKKASFEKSELVFYYTLGTPSFFYQRVKYNEIFRGLQLEGEVTDTEGEKVRLRMEIDDGDGKSGYPYPWKPTVGNIFYCMPEVGTSVCLRFQDKDERHAIAVSFVRSNGNTCEGYSDPQKRIMETAAKKTLKIFPEELSVYGSKEGNMPEISIQDSSGISLNVHKKLEIESVGNITIKAENIQCNAPQSIRQRVSRSSIEVHRDFNFYSPGGVENVEAVTKGSGMNEVASRRPASTFTPCWQATYASTGAVAAYGGTGQEAEGIGLTGVGSLPTLGTEGTVKAMAGAVGGTPLNKNSYAEAFKSIEVGTLNGGYPLPETKIKK